MLPHIERSQDVTPRLVYSRWADRGHHRQVDHAHSSRYLLDDCPGNYRLQSLEGPLLICLCLRAISVFIRPVLFSPRWVRSWCYLFVTNSRFDFPTCRIAKNGGVSWLLEAIDLQDSRLPPFMDGQAESVDEMGNSAASSATARSVLVRPGRNNLKVMNSGCAFVHAMASSFVSKNRSTTMAFELARRSSA